VPEKYFSGTTSWRRPQPANSAPVKTKLRLHFQLSDFLPCKPFGDSLPPATFLDPEFT
jgi:hypothetical protein